MTGLNHPSNLNAWQRWQASTSPVRRAVRALRSNGLPGDLVLSLPNGGTPKLIVAADVTSGPKLKVLLAPARLFGLDRVAILSSSSISADLGPDRTEVRVPPDIGSEGLLAAASAVCSVRAVLSYGHYLGVGFALDRLSVDAGWEHFVLQHGLITPFQPPLPHNAHALSWSSKDAAFWASGRPDVRHTVVGSAMLATARESNVSHGHTSDLPPMFLGQLHGAELPRRGMARAAGSFCRANGAVYRPHPSEVDRLSRLQHSMWERRGIAIDRSGAALREHDGPVVAAFSTGILEAAARGVPAYVHYPGAPDWLREFWQRYQMAPWGSSDPTPAPDTSGDPVAAVRDAVLATIDRTGG